MKKIEKFKASKSSNSNQALRLASHAKLDDFDFGDQSYNSKMKVNCICPKCGEHHVMAFHWIGRGTPRKYCQTCKGGSNG